MSTIYIQYRSKYTKHTNHSHLQQQLKFKIKIDNGVETDLNRSLKSSITQLNEMESAPITLSRAKSLISTPNSILPNSVVFPDRFLASGSTGYSFFDGGSLCRSFEGPWNSSKWCFLMIFCWRTRNTGRFGDFRGCEWSDLMGECRFQWIFIEKPKMIGLVRLYSLPH